MWASNRPGLCVRLDEVLRTWMKDECIRNYNKQLRFDVKDASVSYFQRAVVWERRG